MTLSVNLDEDVDPLLADFLRAAGVDTLSTREAERDHQRISDENQLAYAASLGRAIFTHNVKDYRRLAVSWAVEGRQHAGVILSRQRPLGELLSRFRALASRYPDGMANVCDYL